MTKSRYPSKAMTVSMSKYEGDLREARAERDELRNALRDLLQRHEELAEWDDSKAVQRARELLEEAA